MLCGFRRPVCRRVPTLQHKLGQIVFSGDLEQLKNIIENKRERFQEEMFIDWINDTLLTSVLRTNHSNSKKKLILEYVINLKEFDVNYVNKYGENCLMRSQVSNYPESILDKLLKRGADINLTNMNGCTLLHTGISDSFEAYEVAFMEKVLKENVDVNAQDVWGQTALYVACKKDLSNWVYFFLYYGANAGISFADNILPLSILSIDNSELADDLFDYTFHEEPSEIHLKSVIASMQKSTQLFEKICKRCRTIIYDDFDLDTFAAELRNAKASNFELFINYYGYILEDVILQTPLLKMVLDCGLYMGYSELKKILLALLSSKYITLLVQQHQDLSYPIVTCLIKVCNSNGGMMFEKKEMTEIVLLLLEHGLTISLRDIDTVYKYYGYGDLLKILLHMDVINPAQEQFLEVNHIACICENSSLRDRAPLSAMAQLLYYPNMNLEDCWNDPPAYLDILKLFNSAKVKEQIALDCRGEVLDAIKRMPQVPLLLELSRNVTRKFIMERYKIKKHSEFYTILKTLPLAERYRRVIALEDVLYQL